MKSTQFDGAADEYTLGSVDSSNDSSPITMGMRSVTSQRSSSPAPMTGIVSGTSLMYPDDRFEFQWEAHTPTAIQG